MSFMRRTKGWPAVSWGRGPGAARRAVAHGTARVQSGDQKEQDAANDQAGLGCPLTSEPCESCGRIQTFTQDDAMKSGLCPF